MNAEDFIDTNVFVYLFNVFVYLFDETNADKRQRAESLVHRSLERGTGCISYQVVQETMNIVTRKLGATPESAQRLLDDVLIPLWRINPTAALYRRGLRLQARYEFSFYDSLIVAASLEADCIRLYTEDLQHGQQIQRLTIQSPFVDLI